MPRSPVFGEVVKRQKDLDQLSALIGHANKLSSAQFDELAEHYNEHQIIEVIQLCGYYRTIGYLVGSFDLPLESFSPRFDPRDS